MTGRLVVLVVTLAALLLPTLAHAAVLDFEDLYPGYETSGGLPAGYGGFTWVNGYWATNGVEGPNSGYMNVIQGHVGIFTAYPSATLPISMGGQLFDFKSAIVGAAWDDGQGVRFDGYNSGSLIYSRYLTTDVFGGPETFDFDGIDTLWVTPDETTGIDHGWGPGHQIILDNIEYNTNAVPEPGSLSLLALAFGGVGAVVRRRKKA